MDEQIFEKAWAISKKGQYVFQPGQTMGQRAMTAVGDWARGGEGISRFNNPIEAAKAGLRGRTGFDANDTTKLSQQYTQGKQEAERGNYVAPDANMVHNPALPAQVPLTEKWQYKAAQAGIKPAAPASSAAPNTGAQEIPGDGIDNDGDGLIDEPPTVEEKRSTTINPNTGAPAEQTTSTTVTNPTEQQAATNAAANTTASDGTNPAPAPSGGGQQSVADINAQAQTRIAQPEAQNFTQDTPTQNLIGAQMAEENKQAITDATARSQTSGGLATNPLAFLATGGLANIGGALYNRYQRGQGQRDLLNAKAQRNQLASGNLYAPPMPTYIQNSINEDIADYWELQKTRSHIREYDTTEAIRIAYD